MAAKNGLSEMLNENNEYLSDIFERASVGMYFASSEGRFIRVNKTFCLIVGYSEEELLKRSFEDITHPEDLANDFDCLKELKNGGIDSYKLEKRYIKKDLSCVWVNLTVSCERNEDLSVKYFIGVAIDITDKKIQEKALYDLNKELEKKVAERTLELNNALNNNEKILLEAKELEEKADRSKSEFIANISHEFRTPLNAVIGFSDILYSQTEDVKHRNYLESINNSGKTLLRLINDILDLSKIEAGMIEIKVLPIDPKQIIEEVKSIYKHEAERKRISILIKTDNDLPNYLMLDEIRLRQVLLNIIGNAVKFTDRGFIRITMTQRPSKEQSENKLDLMFTIEDTGIGISEGGLENVFKSFSQQFDSSNKKYAGTGLGLTISKKLVEMMNGELWAQSKVGLGSKFTFILREVSVLKHIPSLNSENIKFDHRNKTNNNKVLIADDVELNRFLLKEIIESFGYEVLSASNGLEAIELTEREKPCIIFMDVIMPEMGGIEATKRIKLNPNTRQIPIIALTAMDSMDDIDGDAEFDGVLNKPITRNMLLSEISKHLSFGTSTMADVLGKNSLYVQEDALTDELRLVIYNEVLPLVNKLKLGVKSNVATELSEVLISTGNEYKFNFFEKKGEKLKSAVGCFDIIKIYECISELDNWLIRLRVGG